MIAAVGNILKSRIEDLPFVDRIAGVVRVLTYKDGSATKIFPAECNTSLEDCLKGKRYLDLAPDSKKKSVIYLEDLGLRPLETNGFKTDWTASFNLIGWLNLPKLGVAGCSYSEIAIQSILKRITLAKKFNSGNYHLVQIIFNGQQPKTTNPFSKYSYDETVNQFLMYPFDYFVLNIDVNFQTDARCFTIPDLNPEINCVKK